MVHYALHPEPAHGSRSHAPRVVHRIGDGLDGEHCRAIESPFCKPRSVKTKVSEILRLCLLCSDTIGFSNLSWGQFARLIDASVLSLAPSGRKLVRRHADWSIADQISDVDVQVINDATSVGSPWTGRS